ncbi:hypothetical protein M0638_20470 [Roseomonas sp. NAR14]|uniref:Uncharacterized protein n=1 Tax=Roseomonas acroporae TaxID=2937791 RepID=A0A9X2BZ72_9PROT|nr:hypothetical protein [Roseomonas acroporae]MCK8786750.1 hypothetical protein [Roseomonas acroporae]
MPKPTRHRRQPRQRAPLPAGPRLLLMPGLINADGEPKAAVALPGNPIPTLFPNVAAALAALRALEVRP